ncbi:MAG: Asp-tRNA(Asn)/Glu-tRNA(Gln) amidotransferase subunit GatB [Patescibacteria group bacterium]
MKSDSYQPTIGLEIHTELKTQTKMFCDCLNDSDEKHPNVNICSVCSGHPGVLPTINKKAVELVLKTGIALGGKVFPKIRSKFDRKNYFYPDLPKGYQISQYDEPLVEGGKLFDVRVRRIHLEEDAGRLVHSDKNYSLVDFNRAGVPLMELVTEPDIKDANQAMEFAKELRLILRYLGVSDADMEKGQLRLEVNVSLAPATAELGTKVEVKNINSFKALGEAIGYEIRRQTELLEAGKKIIQETRGWSDPKKSTVSQRSKEEAHDYRYFPEPDLPPFDSKSFNLKNLKIEVPELPEDKRQRFGKEFGLSNDQANLLVQDMAGADYFEQAASELESPNQINLLFNYITSDLWGLMKNEGVTLENLKITPQHLAHLIGMIDSKEITSRIAKNVLVKMAENGLDPHEIVENEKWTQISDKSQLGEVIEKVIINNPKAAADYKKGKTNALQFLVGMAMSELGGNADPNELREIISSELSRS